MYTLKKTHAKILKDLKIKKKYFFETIIPCMECVRNLKTFLLNIFKNIVSVKILF